MPTIAELPTATQVGAQDELPVSQSGITRSVAVAELLAGTQPALELPSPSLLGRASLGPGGPESLSIGTGLAIQSAALLADGADHAGFTLEQTFQPGDQAIVNANGTPMRLPLTALRALFTGGANVAITTDGTISAATDPGVTSSLGSLSAGLSTADTNIAAISARIPSGGYASVNAAGQVTSPIAADVTQATLKSGAGAVARTLGTRALDVINVLDFGAVQGGGDCTATFEAAFAQLPSSGGMLFVPAGSYWLANPLSFSGKQVAIVGAGRGQTQLHIQHAGIAFDIAPNNLFAKTILRGFTAYAENAAGQTQALARITYPSVTSFGYVTTLIDDVECISYPNAANGVSPFPQTFLRGFILDGCWSSQINNISFFGPPSAAGATNTAAIELNQSFDTRLHGAQIYYGNALVLQTGYCEGIYISSPVVVGTDYLVNQTAQTGWTGYVPNKPMLLGLWVTSGEVNTSLGTVNISNVTDGFFANLDITRDGGPAGAQVFFNLTDCSNFHVHGCNFVGGPTGSAGSDIAFSFSSTWNSSSNIISGCHFEDMATAIKINGSNGTVGLTTYGLHLGSLPSATAILDSTPAGNANYVSFITPSNSSLPAAFGITQDFVVTNPALNPLFRVNNVSGASNYIRHQPAVTGGSPTLCFDGSDTSVSAVIQTKGGNVFFSAGGAPGGGNIVALLNVPAGANWLVLQNAASGAACVISTNTGPLSIQPKGALTLAPTGGLFMNGLPTTKPAAGSGQIWNNGGVLSIA